MRSHPHLYEISAWPWLERLSHRENRAITLDNVPGHEWDAIATAGFDCVYLMGVWTRSAVGRLMARTDPSLIDEYDRTLPGWTMADVPGSPYCIQAYEPDAPHGRVERARPLPRRSRRRAASASSSISCRTTRSSITPGSPSNPDFSVQGTLDDPGGRTEPVPPDRGRRRPSRFIRLRARYDSSRRGAMSRGSNYFDPRDAGGP